MLSEWKIQSELGLLWLTSHSLQVACFGTAPSEEAKHNGTHFLLDIFEAHREALNYTARPSDLYPPFPAV
ncbi:hypothetical protein E4U15_001807 [Claviceps sp. LM218 group G6]|nr:hypothetical protein E4U15_001807 [Claviceps sp. LM218 group G6]KAG6116628.1 hypothetical protein E4U14_008506 [Claviceps sp. LM454 group G7]